MKKISFIFIFFLFSSSLLADDNKKEIENYKDSLKKERHQNIIEIREIIKSFEDVGKIHLGGIPMIADDMMTFIKNDIIVFGFGVFLFMYSYTQTMDL